MLDFDTRTVSVKGARQRTGVNRQWERCHMRPEITDRVYRVWTYQSVDRLPDIEFGYWSQTMRRWLREGLPIELTKEDQAQMFNSKLDAFFQFDDPELTSAGIPGRVHMNPVFDERILERRGESVISTDASGCTAQRYPSDVEESSIPHFIRFPVETPADWERMKERYRFDDPTRARPTGEVETLRTAARAGKALSVFFCGFYGQLRNWMGMENLSVAFYEYPAMVHDMVEHWAELCARQIENLPADFPVDSVSWWEDMACKHGPLCGPEIFREFLQPGYRRVMQVARRHGCELAMVDCDGNPHAIVANWLAEGVNVMYPLEVAAGADPYLWRREFGGALRMKGGIGKEALVQGGTAIDRELERIKPLVEQGGYVPHLDHLVPPDVPYGHYCEYLEKKRKLIGKVTA